MITARLSFYTVLGESAQGEIMESSPSGLTNNYSKSPLTGVIGSRKEGETE